MIPHRVRLSGFLCYKEPQEITFDGASLWMLSGTNGSGKSSIFDAITFALFGAHRGGSQNAQELINKDSPSLSIEFEFLLDGKLYQAKRTLRRGTHKTSTTYQLLRWDGLARSGTGSWQPIEDTNTSTGYKRWIDENIGMSFEIFTSSVLLLQGRAERLLSATPKERFEVLASIVDLERYRRLHERAESKRRALRDQLEKHQGALAGLPAVTEEELASAQYAIDCARDRREQVQAQIESYQNLRHQAVEWSKLQERLSELVDRWEKVNAILESAEQLSRDYARLVELNTVLPHLKEILVQRTAIDECERQIGKLTRDQQAWQKTADELNKQLKQKLQTLAEYKAALNQDENQLTKQREELAQCQRHVDRLNLHDQLSEQLKQLQVEKQGLPSDNPHQIERLQQEFDQLQTLDKVRDRLRQFAQTRDILRNKSSELTQTETDEQASKSAGLRVRAQLDQAKARHDELSQQERTASETVSEVRSRLRQAEDALNELESLEGSKLCRHCGQALTPAHLEQERIRRHNQREALAKEHAQALVQQRVIKQQLDQVSQDVQSLQDKVQKLRDEYTERHAAAHSLRQQIKQYQSDARNHYRDLPHEVQLLIAQTLPDDVTTTVYPTPQDLEKLQRRLDDLPGVRDRLAQARKHQQLLDRIAGQVATLQQSLDRVKKELPNDKPESIRQRTDELAVAVKMLQQDINRRKQTITITEGEIEKQRQELKVLEQEIHNCNSDLKSQQLKRSHAEEQLNRAKRSLPEDWYEQGERLGISGLHILEVERNELIDKKTEENYKQIEPARIGRENLRQEIERAKSEDNRYPEIARQSPAAIDTQIRDAQNRLKACEHELAEAIKQHSALESRNNRRKEILDEITTLEVEQNWFSLLAQLLGRDRLQRHLIRHAERQIIDHANAALDRLSNGQLYLRLVNQDPSGKHDHALELEAFNRSTGEQPINVAFLSGSQRFRVAVALALGIGQYASKQHRPIESVIIDEGFGCLDRQGRQVMIQELQNLRDNMKCILLVSHQEDIAEAFPDGYHFEMDNGTTRISRVTR